MNSQKDEPSYYAIIPADVRYDKNLKPMEKLMYGEITCLSNKIGYCFASNSYFAELYGVDKKTVSRWISNLEKNKYIAVQIIRNENKEVVERKIFLMCSPAIFNYLQKCHYISDLNVTTSSDEKVTYNNTSNNNINLINTDKTKTSPVASPKKKNSKAPLFDAIASYTEDLTLRRILGNYLQFMLKNTKGYTLEQWQIQLERLSKYSKGDLKKAIEKVSSAYSSGYRQLVFDNELTEHRIMRPNNSGSFMSSTSVDVVTQEDIENCPF